MLERLRDALFFVVFGDLNNHTIDTGCDSNS